MAKEFEPEDPMELVGVELPASNVDQVLDSIVQEYLFIGWGPAQIFFIFRSPYYGVSHQIYEIKGHDYVKERIRSLAEQWNSGWLTGRALSQTKGGEPNAQGA